MWFDGYKRQRIETPVYSDVAIQIQKWRCDQEIKLFVFSNGWAEATKRFMSQTNHGMYISKKMFKGGNEHENWSVDPV